MSNSRSAAIGFCLRGIIVAATLTVAAVAAMIACQPVPGL